MQTEPVGTDSEERSVGEDLALSETFQKGDVDSGELVIASPGEITAALQKPRQMQTG